MLSLSLPPGAKIRGCGVLLPCWPLLLRDLEKADEKLIKIQANCNVVISNAQTLIYLLIRRYIRERQEIVPDRAQRSKNLCEGCNDEVLAMAVIEREKA